MCNFSIYIRLNIRGQNFNHSDNILIFFSTYLRLLFKTRFTRIASTPVHIYIEFNVCYQHETKNICTTMVYVVSCTIHIMYKIWSTHILSLAISVFVEYNQILYYQRSNVLLCIYLVFVWFLSSPFSAWKIVHTRFPLPKPF